MSTEEAEFSHEWTTGEWKVEVNFDSEDSTRLCISGGIRLAGSIFSILPIYDSGGYLESVSNC